MTTTHVTKTEFYKRKSMNTIPAQKVKPEVEKLLDNIERLRAVLYTLTPLPDTECVEVITLAQAALKTIRQELGRCFDFQHTPNYQNQLDNWDNEGGRIAYASR